MPSGVSIPGPLGYRTPILLSPAAADTPEARGSRPAMADRSIVWASEDSADTCAAAEAAGEAAVGVRAPVVPLALDVRSSFTWDGDAYR